MDRRKTGIGAIAARRGALFVFLFAVLMIGPVGGCSAPAFHLVHDGSVRPAEVRYGRMRPAGAMENIVDHVITVDGQGVPHESTNPHGRALCIGEFRGQIARIFRAMDKFHRAHPDRKILIFVHGGLNSPGDSLGAADAEIEPIMDAGYYPIFLDWDSDIFDTYGEHISRITQGQTDDSVVRRLLTPLYMAADGGRSVARIPVVWFNQVGTDLSAASADVHLLVEQGLAPAPTTRPAPMSTVKAEDASSQRWANARQGKAIAQVYARLRGAELADVPHWKPGMARHEIHIVIGPDMDLTNKHRLEMDAAYFLTAPVKFALAWVIDALGTPAWQNMSRRTLMAFDGQLGGNPNFIAGPSANPHCPGSSPRDVAVANLPREDRAAAAQDFNTTGALAVFRDELQRIMKHARDKGHPYRVTLVGHSMGTMVLNEWLRRDLLESAEHEAQYVNIVYMAAACSVRDFGRAAVPYLLEHPQTQFYNLMLHPLADLRERRRLNDLPPRGSLLVWLDDFLTDPQTSLDRTLGRWDNIIPATEMIPRSIRGQITLKAFALAPYDDDTPPPGEPDYGPQVHGQFRDKPYWLPEFWYSESAIIPSSENENLTSAATRPAN